MDLDDKPKGLAFTAQGRAIVGLDMVCSAARPEPELIRR
jgi:hypothetical protein